MNSAFQKTTTPWSMAEIVPAKPATRVVDNAEIKALPALRSADLADADKLYDEIASCHAVKKRKRKSLRDQF